MTTKKQQAPGVDIEPGPNPTGAPAQHNGPAPKGKLAPHELMSSLGFATHLLEQQIPKDQPKQDASQSPQDAPQSTQTQQSEQQVNPLQTQFQQFETKVTSELQQLNQSIQQLLKEEQAEPGETS